jgi:hypothetical protein
MHESGSGVRPAGACIRGLGTSSWDLELGIEAPMGEAVEGV